MSFCPTNDIHSVYLDNELPEQFKSEYEQHISNCPQCQKELAKLKAVKAMFQIDSKAITPDSHYLDESFERLKVKMSYSKNTSKQTPKLQIKDIGYYAMAAAAVAAFAFIVPNVGKSKNMPETANPVVASAQTYLNSANNVSFDSGRSVVISGNIGGAALSSVSTGMNYQQNSHGHGGHHKNNMMRDVEMFRPRFMENEGISIKVTLPGMQDGPISPDMTFPEQVITGNFE